MSIIARMIEAGVPADIIEDVAMLVAEKRAAEKAIESRREKDRERTARRRSRDVTECHVTERDPSLSLPPNEIISNPPTHTHPDNTPVRVKGPAKPDGVNDQTWADFLTLRKAKRAPVSGTVIDGIRREAGKVGWSLEAALAECVTRGWQSFKSDWVDAAKPPGGGAQPNEFLAHLTAKRQRGQSPPNTTSEGV